MVTGMPFFLQWQVQFASREFNRLLVCAFPSQAHLAISSAMYSENSSGVLATTSIPFIASAALIFGAFRALTIAPLRVMTTGIGVLRGATSPSQLSSA